MTRDGVLPDCPESSRSHVISRGLISCRMLAGNSRHLDAATASGFAVLCAELVVGGPDKLGVDLDDLLLLITRIVQRRPAAIPPLLEVSGLLPCLTTDVTSSLDKLQDDQTSDTASTEPSQAIGLPGVLLSVLLSDPTHGDSVRSQVGDDKLVQRLATWLRFGRKEQPEGPT
mmetsp:Transcript_28318/g.67019  ORF Transcript_28318/g.67019 Transcript_28318/m.67019 type:complete len:172 (+) Transcript_28318:241-756(+)